MKHLSLLSCVALASVVVALLPGCPPDTPPVAAFRAEPQEGPPPLTVQFADISLSGSADITAWAWDFGDGGTSTEASPLHTYTAAGLYTVSLTVTSSAGSTTTTLDNFIHVANNFHVRLINSGDYPINEFHFVRADAVDFGINQLGAPLEPGKQILLNKSFTRTDYIVGVIFRVDNTPEGVVLDGNLQPEEIVEDVVVVRAGRFKDGHTSVEYAGGVKKKE